MLHTPLGPIIITVNEMPIPYNAQPFATTHRCPDVDGRFMIELHHLPQQAIVRCYIEAATESFPESGERFEGIAFYQDSVKLTIGTQAEFPPDAGRLLPNGIELIASTATFGICWIDPVTDANDVQTYFGADLDM